MIWGCAFNNDYLKMIEKMFKKISKKNKTIEVRY